MRTKKVNIRIGNIELRKYKGWNDPEIDGNISDKYEFVKWENANDKEYFQLSLQEKIFEEDEN